MELRRRGKGRNVNSTVYVQEQYRPDMGERKEVRLRKTRRTGSVPS
jgi:hypothetical protein